MKTDRSEQMTIPLPGGPDIPGLCLRRFAGKADYELVRSIVQQSYDADGLDRFVSLEDVARFFEDSPNFDPLQDMLFVQVGSQAVGCLDVTWRRETAGRRTYRIEGCILPSWRRRHIGSAMLAYAEQRLREIAAEHPNDGPRFFRAWAEDKDIGKVTLLEASGYMPVRFLFKMVRSSKLPLDDVPLPASIEIRPAKPEHYRAVWQAMDEAFQDDPGHFPHTQEHYRAWIKGRRFQPDLWTIAWDGDQVAGMILNYIDEEENRERNRKRGYTEDICVRRSWRRQGLARAMLVRSIRRLMDLGMTEAALGVDTDNPNGALRLYTSVGFEPVRNVRIFEKPLS